MPPVEHRDREQIDQSDADRQHRGDSHEFVESEFGRPPGYLSNGQGPPELIGVFLARYDPFYEMHGARNDAPGFGKPEFERLDGIFPLVHERVAPRPGNPHQADSDSASKPIVDFTRLRHDLKFAHRPAPLDLDDKRFAGPRHHDALDVVEGIDRAAVDAPDDVPGLDAGRFGGTARLHRVHARFGARDADDHEG